MSQKFFFLFGCSCSMRNFSSQVLNPRHSCNLSHCSENTRALSCWITRELLISHNLIDIMVSWLYLWLKQLSQILLLIWKIWTNPWCYVIKFAQHKFCPFFFGFPKAYGSHPGQGSNPYPCRGPSPCRGKGNPTWSQWELPKIYVLI